MLGVSNKHRYFRIQVIVGVTASTLAYMAAKAGIVPATPANNPAAANGISIVTYGSFLAALTLTYFQHGALSLWRPLVYGCLLFGLAFISPILIGNIPALRDFPLSGPLYIWYLNAIGFLIFAGIAAWLGKVMGLLTLAALAYSGLNGFEELVLLGPVLSLLNITNLYAQWAVAIAMAISSFLADR